MEQATPAAPVVFLLLDAAAARRSGSGHARALGVVVVVVVDLLRAVLADLHEEGVELRHHERDPDSEACVRCHRADDASMAWGWSPRWTVRCKFDCRGAGVSQRKIIAKIMNAT